MPTERLKRRLARDGARVRRAVRHGGDGVGRPAAARRRVRLRAGHLALHRLPPLRVRVRRGEQPVARSRRCTGSACSRWRRSKGVDFSDAEPVLQPEEVPEEGHFYVPVACQQCRNAPCTKVCPTGATWTEPDGIVVIDYDWCIGCRCCMAACPYGARHFNWARADHPEGAAQPEHALPRQPPAPEGRGREVHVLHPAHARRPVSGLRRGLPGRARASSATCSIPTARSATSSSTSACSCSRRS